MKLEDIYRRLDFYTASLLQSLEEKPRRLTLIALDALPTYRPYFSTSNVSIELCNDVPGISLSIRWDKKTIYVKHQKSYPDAHTLAKNFRVYSLITDGKDEKFSVEKKYEENTIPLLTYSLC